MKWDINLKSLGRNLSLKLLTCLMMSLHNWSKIKSSWKWEILGKLSRNLIIREPSSRNRSKNVEIRSNWLHLCTFWTTLTIVKNNGLTLLIIECMNGKSIFGISKSKLKGKSWKHISHLMMKYWESYMTILGIISGQTPPMFHGSHIHPKTVKSWMKMHFCWQKCLTWAIK